IPTPHHGTCEMSEVKFVDTTLRDGHQSLWAEAMRTGIILPISSQMDRAGFEAIEIFSPSFFKKCVRELKEDPLERIRMVAQRSAERPRRAGSEIGRWPAFTSHPRRLPISGWSGWRPMV